MLIHLTPSFFLQYANISVKLVDVVVPELGIHLEEGKDITVRFPAPNKRLHYVCRKKGRRAIYGILLNTDKPVTDITVITRWAVQGHISVHRVHMHITGTGEAATDVIQLWSAVRGTSFVDCTPPGAGNWVPASCQPRLTVAAADRTSCREPAIWRRTDPAGIIREQTEFFTAAAVEPARLSSPWRGMDRLPAADDAFSCTVREAPDTVHVLWAGAGVTVCPLSEQAGLIETDLGREGLQDAFARLIRPVLDDVRGICPLFFTNTDNLMNCIRRFSARYRALPEQDRQFVEQQINQPLFEIVS